MEQLNYNGQIIEYHISETNIHIKDSYKITSTRDMVNILGLLRQKARELGYLHARDENSWVNEWVAHNVLYKLHYQPQRTESVDLNENESKFRLFCYPIIAFFFKRK